MQRYVVLLVAGLLLCIPGRAQTPANGDASTTSPTQLDLQSYQRELTHISETLLKPTEIPALRRSLPESWTVRDGERIYNVPTKEISEALREIQVDPKKNTAALLEARLDAMRQQTEELAHPSASSNMAEAADKLKKIMERGEFREVSGPSRWDLLRARVIRWIVLHVLKLLGLLHLSHKTGNTIVRAVLFLAVVLLFYVAYLWLTKSSGDANFRATAEPTQSDARRWVHDALAAADRGDFREAVHCAYWASVAHLEDIRLLPRDRARTPRESLQLLDQYPKEQGILRTVTRSFELIWYGYRPVSASEWAGTKEQLEKIGCLQASIAPTVPS
ncbi:MAG: DUF4129 domain-containing protein [Candidatus Acidiferrum sp.]